MNIIKCSDLGFCQGVNKSIEMALDHPDSLLLGNLVHNKAVTKQLLDKGLKYWDYQDYQSIDIDKYPLITISAHGLSQSKRQYFENKGFTLIDTTCPIVRKAHQQIIDYLKRGYHIIYLANESHREAMAITDDYQVTIINRLDDIEKLAIFDEKMAIAGLTTTDYFAYCDLIERIKNKYPQVQIIDTLCPLTKKCQMELKDLVLKYQNTNTAALIIGDELSNNTQMLAQIVKRFSSLPVYLLEESSQEVIASLCSFTNVIVASGTSTPRAIIEKIIADLNNQN